MLFRSKMFEETKGRPIYLVRDMLNLGDSELSMDSYPRWRGYARLEKQRNRDEDLFSDSEDVKIA